MRGIKGILGIGATVLTLTLPQTSFSQTEEEVQRPTSAVERTKKGKEKIPTRFGFQVKPIIPTGWVSPKTISYDVDEFHTDISQKSGYSLGGVIRFGLTKTIAIETGISTTQRRYRIQSSVADSNVFSDQNIRFVSYEIPISALFYIRLTEKFYMNASIGVSGVYTPTLARVSYLKENSKHQIFHTILAKKFQMDVLANIGFEYRTKDAGIFYVGASVKVPVQPMLYMSSQYNYDGYVLRNDPYRAGKIAGSYISLDIKYFFPLTTKSKTPPVPKGPIEY